MKNTINIGIPSKGRLRKDVLKIFKRKKLKLISERGERDLSGSIKNNKNLKNDSAYKSNYKNIENNDNLTNNSLKSEVPNNIFYSLIDNSESLDETSNVNHSLRKSELNQINMNSRKANFSKKLTTEEELYDEFNYLLDE